MTRKRLFDRKGSKPNPIDTIQEVLAIYAVLIAVTTTFVGRVEGWGLQESIWFGVVTVTTTGYGDITPKTMLGEIGAGTLMIGAFVLNVLLAGLVAAKLIVDSDAWTHTEQENMKADIAAIKAVVVPEEA